jgi:hypothetical protein
VGSEGTALHYTDGQWRLVPAPTGARLLDVHFDGPGDGWAVGGDGTVLRYDEAGWHTLPRPVEADLRALGWAGSDYGWAVGNEGSVACYRVAHVGTPLVGCNGEPVSQTLELPHPLFLPVVGQSAWAHSPVGLFGVQTTDDTTLSRDPAIVHQMAEAGIRWARLPFSGS